MLIMTAESLWRGASAVAVMGMLVAVPARAADAPCCDDLEEGIAQLEASAALKGTRKVTLTVSGVVLQELTYWDDGGERNAYVHGLPSQTSHFKFGGEARIAPDWTGGFLFRLQDFSTYPFLRLPDAFGINQASDERDFGLQTHMAYWYVQNASLGKVTMGRMSHAAKSVAMLTDQSGTQNIDNYTFLSGLPQLVIRSGGDLLPATLTWAEVAFCYMQGMPLGGDCNGVAMEGVRFDTPTYKGLSLAASWGLDDFWELALRYSGEKGGLKLAFGAGYSLQRTEQTFGPAVMARKNSEYLQAGGYLHDVASGLFIHGAYGLEDNNNTELINGRSARDGKHWTLKAGLRKDWTGLGATVLYGDYTEYEDQLGPAALALGAETSTLRRYSGGLAQELEAAAMTIYLKYQRYEAEIAGAGLDPDVTDLDTASFLSVGGLIAY
jgi:hypothetical protein